MKTGDVNALLEFLRPLLPMPWERFMGEALYHPDLGYYARGKVRTGRKGDFFTNVSVGAMYGRLLALDLEQRWERLGRPARFTVVEQGANDGLLARDLLAAAAGAFREVLQYVIVEPFAALETLQREALKTVPSVRWYKSLATVPAWTGAHLSNELIDAFPVRRVVFRSDRWWECGVDWQNGTLAWCDLPLQGVPPQAAGSEGFITEVRNHDAPWLRDVLERMERGWVLAVDYGMEREAYYDDSRNEGTLRAYRNHSVSKDLLAAPGEQDLTAHVEWTTLREVVGSSASMQDQHRFLMAQAERLFAKGNLDAAARRQFMTLIHPEMMGRAFQVLEVEKT